MAAIAPSESPEERRLQVLRKAVDQGSKLETLNGTPEFQFFLEWVKRVRDELGNKIMKGDLIQVDPRVQAHAQGGYKYLDDVLNFAETLPKKAVKAREVLKKYVEDQDADE